MKKTQEERESTITRYINGSPNFLMDIGVGPKTEYLTLKKYYPNMICVGLEPRIEMFEKLKFKFPGILLPYAISNNNKQVELFINNNLTEASGIISSIVPNNSTSYNVPAITLDDLDKSFTKPKNILLWMDIEGAELLAIKGGKNLLKSGRVKWINLEAREPKIAKRDGVVSINELKKELKKYDYCEVLRYPYPRKTGHFDSIFIHQDEISKLSEIAYKTSFKNTQKAGLNYTDLKLN